MTDDQTPPSPKKDHLLVIADDLYDDLLPIAAKENLSVADFITSRLKRVVTLNKALQESQARETQLPERRDEAELT